MTLQPLQIAYFFGTLTGINLSDGGGSVRLLKPSGAIADAFTYPAVERADRTWCRQPDGTGTWGFNCLPSPGRPNIFLNTSKPGAQAGNQIACLLENAIPQPISLAECGRPDSGITNNPGEKVYWLQSNWKWMYLWNKKNPRRGPVLHPNPQGFLGDQSQAARATSSGSKMTSSLPVSFSCTLLTINSRWPG